MKRYIKSTSITNPVNTEFMHRYLTDFDIVTIIDIDFQQDILASKIKEKHITPDEYKRQTRIYNQIVSVVEDVIGCNSDKFYLVKSRVPSDSHLNIMYKDGNGIKHHDKVPSNSYYYTMFAKKDRCLMNQWVISLRMADHPDYHMNESDSIRNKNANEYANGNNPDGFNIGRDYTDDNVLKYNIYLRTINKDGGVRLTTTSLPPGSKVCKSNESQREFIEEYLLMIWKKCNDSCTEFYYRGHNIHQLGDEFTDLDSNFISDSLIDMRSMIDDALGDLTSSESKIYCSRSFDVTSTKTIYKIIDDALDILNSICQDGDTFTCVNIYFLGKDDVIVFDILGSEKITSVDVDFDLDDLSDADAQKNLVDFIVEEVLYTYSDTDKFEEWFPD